MFPEIFLLQHIPLPHVIFTLDIGKHFFTERVVRHWTRLPEGMVSALALSLFERHLDNVLNLWSALKCSGCWTGWLLWVPSNWNILFYSIPVYPILFLLSLSSLGAGEKEGMRVPKDMAVPWGCGQQISSGVDARAVPTCQDVKELQIRSERHWQHCRGCWPSTCLPWTWFKLNA